MRSRPRLDVPTEPLDRLLELVGLVGLAWVAVPVAVAWSSLPEQVPTHFDVAGRPDAWGDRSILLLLPVLAAALYGLLWFVGRFPHLHNFPFEVHGHNAARAYGWSRRLLRFLRVMIAFTFGLLVHNSIAIARGNPPLSVLWLYVAVAASILVPLVGVVLLYRRERRREESEFGHLG